MHGFERAQLAFFPEKMNPPPNPLLAQPSRKRAAQQPSAVASSERNPNLIVFNSRLFRSGWGRSRNKLFIQLLPEVDLLRPLLREHLNLGHYSFPIAYALGTGDFSEREIYLPASPICRKHLAWATSDFTKASMHLRLGYIQFYGSIYAWT